jgi:hypothetical protein
VVLERAGLKRAKGYHCDHINGDTLDNRLVNLRFTTPSINRFNSKLSKNKRTGLPRGVAMDDRMRTRKYWSWITFNGKRFVCGYFATPEEAHEAYKTKAMELYGSLPYSVKG